MRLKRWFFTLALILTFSPKEKEQLTHVAWFANEFRQIQSHIFYTDRKQRILHDARALYNVPL